MEEGEENPTNVERCNSRIDGLGSVDRRRNTYDLAETALNREKVTLGQII